MPNPHARPALAILPLSSQLPIPYPQLPAPQSYTDETHPPTIIGQMDEPARTILDLYARGLFPMAEPGGEIYLYDPDPRAIIPLDNGGLRVPRSLRQRVRSGRFTITTDRAFGRVIRACAAPRDDQPEGTWIDERIIAIYEDLHAAGHAHSVEAWLGGAAPDARLVGGLYGVHLGGLFAGESMFSRPDLGGTDASKVCLVHLWHHIRGRGFTLLDAQFINPHLVRLGAVEISRGEYLRRLGRASGKRTDWLPFTPTPPG